MYGLLPLVRFNPAKAAQVSEGSSSQEGADSADPLLPLFPLPLVLFPQADLVLHIFEERYKLMIRECLLNRWEFGILLMAPSGIENVGCTAAITEIIRGYRNGEMDILVQGRRRFRVSNWNQEKAYLRGEAEFFDDNEGEQHPEQLKQQARELYERFARLLAEKDPSVKPPALSPEVQRSSFAIMSAVPADHAAQQRMLVLRSERDRLVEVILHLQQLIDLVEKGPESLTPKSRAELFQHGQIERAF